MTESLFQILVTTLLAIVMGLAAWALTAILAQRKDADDRHLQLKEALAAQHLQITTEITKISQQIWGRDGNNGHNSDIRHLRRSFRRIERYITQLGFRLQRVEEKVGLPSGEHAKFGGDEDEAEGD